MRIKQTAIVCDRKEIFRDSKEEDDTIVEISDDDADESQAQ